MLLPHALVQSSTPLPSPPCHPLTRSNPSPPAAHLREDGFGAGDAGAGVDLPRRKRVCSKRRTRGTRRPSPADWPPGACTPAHASRKHGSAAPWMKRTDGKPHLRWTPPRSQPARCPDRWPQRPPSAACRWPPRRLQAGIERQGQQAAISTHMRRQATCMQPAWATTAARQQHMQLGSDVSLTRLQAHGAQPLCDVRAAVRQLAVRPAVQLGGRRLVRPHNGRQVGVAPCGGSAAGRVCRRRGAAAAVQQQPRTKKKIPCITIKNNLWGNLHKTFFDLTPAHQPCHIVCWLRVLPCN